MTPDAAVEMGAMALFGEKYGEEVRVVTMGAAGGQQAGLVDRTMRRHACPPHRRYRLFPRSSAESAVAAGVRRIEAVTGAAAEAVVAARPSAA